MPSLTSKRTIRIGIALVLLTLIAIGWRATDGPRGWTTNHAQIEPRRFTVGPEQVFDAVIEIVDGQPRWTLIGHSDDGSRTHLVLERTSRLFRFVDDIALQLSPDGTGTLVTGESRSRVGKGDLGQNARNLRKLLGAMERQLASGNSAAP